jgi:hypothetical protein
MVLKLHKQPRYLSFSSNASKVMISSGQEFSVYDVEYDNPYRFTIKSPLNNERRPAWMDGHRLVDHSGGKAFIFDFDGKNRHELAPTDSSLPALFDDGYERLYSIGVSAKSKGKAALLQTNLRTPEDLSGGLFN